MAGLFKTGKELLAERNEELAEQQTALMARGFEQAPLQAGAASIGAGLGRMLGGMLAGDDEKDAAGDVATEADLGTSKGNFDYAKQMRDAGFEEEAQALEDRAIKLYKYEASVAASQQAGDLDKAAEPTDNQLEGILGYWASRDDEFGEMTQQILENSEDDPTAAWGLKNLNRQVAVNVNEMQRDLEAKGLSVPRTFVEKTFVDMLAAEDVMKDDSFFGGFFGKEPVVDLKAMDKTIGATRGKVMDFLTSRKTTAEDAPVETAPAQASTQMPGPAPGKPEDSRIHDVQGRVPEEAQVQGVPLTDPLPEMRKDAANEIKQIDKELRRMGKDPKKVQQLIQLQKRRKLLLDNITSMS